MTVPLVPKDSSLYGVRICMTYDTCDAGESTLAVVFATARKISWRNLYRYVKILLLLAPELANLPCRKFEVDRSFMLIKLD